jgi:hypothetical protein
MNGALIATFAVTLVLGLAHAAPAADTFKHTGTIADFDDRTGTIVLAEVGPWRGGEGAAVVTSRRIAVTRDTAFAIVFRAEDPATGFGGDFVEVPLEAAGVYVGDVVTVECLQDGPRVIARKITVVDLPGAEYRKEGNGS